MRAFLTGLPGAMACLLIPAALPAAAPEGITSFTLPNGLMGVVIEDHRAPVVTQMVWYKVGSADEPAGQSGLAHFLEHLMFKATGTLADGEFSQVVAANGGEDNAFTTPDHTAYFQRIAADRLDLVMGDGGRPHGQPRARARRPCRSERDVVVEERRERVENSPDGPFDEQMRRGPLPQPALRPAGDRLGAGDRRLHPRDGAGLLPHALRAQQRDPGGGRRRRARRGRAPGRGALRADPGLAGHRAAGPPAGAEAGRGAAVRDAATRACASLISRGSTSRRSARPATRRKPRR